MNNSIKNMNWLTNYYNKYIELIFDDNIYESLFNIRDLFYIAWKKGKKVIFVGNGGSASIASHCAVDLTKSAGIRSICFNEASLITCFGNDYGYERWVEKAIEFYCDNGDVLVAISSSGESQNIISSVKAARKKDMPVITLSGFKKDNQLSTIGDINLWVDSEVYNIVEMAHNIWLLGAIDLINDNVR